MTDKVPNVYKHMLVNARSSADGRAETIRSALNAASLALMAGAWKSTLADEFVQALSDHRRTLQTVVRAERDAIDAEVAIQPDEVPPDSWQADFARLSRNTML